MLSDKQISLCLHLIKSACYVEDSIQDWYDDQATHNGQYQDGMCNYKDQIIVDKIKDADHYLITGLITDLKKIAYEEDYDEEFVDSVLNRLEKL